MKVNINILKDECNWILSGRDPLPDNIEEEDENTLDDISGDEVGAAAELCQNLTSQLRCAVW